MSGLAGFFRGYNEMGRSIQDERLAMLRAGLMQDALDSLSRKRKDEEARRAYVSSSLAGRGVQSSAGVVASEPQTMAVAGVVPTNAALAESTVKAPSHGVSSSTEQTVSRQRIEINGRKKDDVVDALSASRDWYLKEGRAEEAAATQQKLAQHYQTKLAEKELLWKETLAPTARKVAGAELGRQVNSLAMSMLSDAASAHYRGMPDIATTALNQLNSLMAAEGNPQWEGDVSGFIVEESNDPKAPAGKIYLKGQDGQPMKGSSGKPVFFTQQQWQQAAGVDRGTKLTTVAEGASVLATGPDGQTREVFHNPKAPEGDKPSHQRLNVNDAIKGIDSMLGKVEGENGRMMGSVFKGEELRHGDYKAFAERQIKAGADTQQVVQYLNEHWLRDQAMKKKYDPASLRGDAKSLPKVGGQPKPFDTDAFIRNALGR
ncbi:MAG: hypothetical protein ACRC2G_06725 [Aestuariivirga sp.]